MMKVLRRLLYVGLALLGIWGVSELQQEVMEPIVTEVKVRKFLLEFSIALEQFDGPEFRRAPPYGFNRYSWNRQDGDQALEVYAENYGSLICLVYVSSGKPYRDICQSSDDAIFIATDCDLYSPDGGGPYVGDCQPIFPTNPGEAKLH